MAFKLAVALILPCYSYPITRSARSSVSIKALIAAPSSAWIQDPLALQILEGKILPGQHIRVDRDAKCDTLRFEPVPLKQARVAAKK